MWLQVNMINNLTKECDFSIGNLYLISEKKFICISQEKFAVVHTQCRCEQILYTKG